MLKYGCKQSATLTRRFTWRKKKKRLFFDGLSVTKNMSQKFGNKRQSTVDSERDLVIILAKLKIIDFCVCVWI